MICIKKRYFNLNRLFLLPVGLWPEKQTKLTRLHATVLCTILMSFIAFQIKYLLDRLQCIYDELKDENEIAIYDKYGYNAKRFIMRLLICTICGICSSSLIPYWPYILDVLMPKNETYAIRMMELVSMYFVVPEKYYLFIILHMNAACSTGIVVFVATGTAMMTYIIHICGIFEIASYRLKQAMAIELLRNFTMENEIVIYKEIISAVDIHRKAMQFIDFFLFKFEETFFLIVLITVLCMSFNLFRIFQIESPVKEMEEVLLHLFVVAVILSYMFGTNYCGQQITDHSNHLYITTYNVSWYFTSIRIQKMMLFLLQRSSKTFTMSVGGLFTASLECFATLASASISYFTFMYSMQN